jgi:NADH-quinone oxidoreductase subunit L
MGIAGIALAWAMYIVSPGTGARIAGHFPRLYRFLLNKWYFDELYDAVFVRPAKAFGLFLWKVFDEKIIDGLGPNGAAFLTHLSAVRVGRIQTGFVYHYAFAMLLGFMVLLTWVVFGS